MKQCILNREDKDVKVFKISLNDSFLKDQFFWESEDEFGLNGFMYDVIKKEVRDKELIIYCISDEKETKFINIYNKINHENNNSSKQKWASIIRLMASSLKPEVFVCFLGITVVKKHSYPNFIAFLTSSFDRVITPPPQVS